MAWYEATVATKAEIVILGFDHKMIAALRRTFDRNELNDRITLMEGLARELIEKLTGTTPSDDIFVDANKDGYQEYVKTLLDRDLLDQHGLLVCDDGVGMDFLHNIWGT